MGKNWSALFHGLEDTQPTVMNSRIVIVRGKARSGKATFAKRHFPGCLLFKAKDYPSESPELSHNKCMHAALDAFNEGFSVVVALPLNVDIEENIRFLEGESMIPIYDVSVYRICGESFAPDQDETLLWEPCISPVYEIPIIVDQKRTDTFVLSVMEMLYQYLGENVSSKVYANMILDVLRHVCFHLSRLNIERMDSAVVLSRDVVIQYDGYNLDQEKEIRAVIEAVLVMDR